MSAAEPSPWVGLPALARAAVAYIEAETGPAPTPAAAERLERVQALAEQVDAWAAQVDRWTLVADQTRAAAAAATAAQARPGETPYQTQARLLGRDPG